MVAKCEALNDALPAADDGWVRIEDDWLALASELRARLSGLNRASAAGGERSTPREVSRERAVS